MAHRIVTLLFFIVISHGLCAQNNYAKGELIVKFNGESFRNQTSSELLSILDLDSTEYSIHSNFPLLRSTPRDVNHELNRIFSLRFSKEKKFDKLMRSLSNHPAVEYCEPRYFAKLAFTPNDPSFSSQSFLNQVRAVQAWDSEKGDTNIVIAIVDAGIALNHPDLENKIFLNRNDPVNGLDDDNDGYPDNYYGWNLVDNNSNVSYTDSDHGVHVAGIAAAETNNGIGVSGVGFNVKVMPLLAGKRIEVSHGYEAIVYAVDHGADIINCSWGEYYPSFLGKDAVEYAANAGVLVVAAAGNESSEDRYFPAAYDEVMAVVSVDDADFKAGSSNYGFYTDIAAPGVRILSTTGTNTYNTRSGTSMAAPVVSGAAALLMSKYPNYSYLEIWELLKQSADSFPSNPVNDNYRFKMGQGRLNIEAALNYSAPVWKLSNIELKDNDDNRNEAGDSLQLYFDISSLLASSGPIDCKLSSNSGFVNVIDSQYTILGLTQNIEQKVSKAFLVEVKASPTNSIAEFKLSLNDGNQVKELGFKIDLNLSYLNVEENRLRTSLSSNGMIGYSKYPEKDGLGLLFESGASLMYEGGFILAANTSQGNSIVFDRLRGVGDVEQNDWRVEQAWKPYAAGKEYLASSVFNDSSATAPYGLEITQKVAAFDSAGIDACIMLEYQIKNHRIGEGPLDPLYLGLACDFDIGNYLKNKGDYDGQRYLAYTYSDEFADKGVYLGLQLLDFEESFRVYHISAEAGGEGGVDIEDNDVFTEEEKYEVLSESKPTAGKNSGGTDVFQFVGAGPLTLDGEGDSLRIRFVIHAATSLDSLKMQADAIYKRYKGFLPSSANTLSEESSFKLYPNPVRAKLTVKSEGVEHLKIRDLSGKEHTNRINQTRNGDAIIMDVSALASGLYFVEIQTKSANTSKRFVKL